MKAFLDKHPWAAIPCVMCVVAVISPVWLLVIWALARFAFWLGPLLPSVI